jgi:hypothetical protein
MAKLSTKARKELPAKDFALGKGHYPIEDKAHARNALSRVSQFGSSSEKARVRAAVHNKYPSIGDKGKARERVSKWAEGKRRSP